MRFRDLRIRDLGFRVWEESCILRLELRVPVVDQYNPGVRMYLQYGFRV